MLAVGVGTTRETGVGVIGSVRSAEVDAVCGVIVGVRANFTAVPAIEEPLETIMQAQKHIVIQKYNRWSVMFPLSPHIQFLAMWKNTACKHYTEQ